MVYTKRSFSSVDRGEHHGSIDNSITYASVVKGEKTPNKKYSAAFVDNDVRTESPSLGIATGDFGDGFILVTKRTRRKQGRKVGHRITKGGTFPGKGRQITGVEVHKVKFSERIPQTTENCLFRVMT